MILQAKNYEMLISILDKAGITQMRRIVPEKKRRFDDIINVTKEKISESRLHPCQAINLVMELYSILHMKADL
jgi:hypothetical protein